MPRSEPKLTMTYSWSTENNQMSAWISSHLLQHTVIIEHHGRATDLLNVWLDDHRSRQNLEGQFIIEDWDLTKQSIGQGVQRGMWIRKRLGYQNITQ